MRRFAIFLLLLGVGFAIVNWAYLLLMRRIDWNFSKAIEAQAFANKDLDILILGNSTAMDGVNAEILSQAVGESHNFALGGATLEANWVQLDRYLAQNARPQHVFLFLSSCHLNYGIQSGVNPMIDAGTPETPGLKDMPLYAFRWLLIENVKKLISHDHRTATVVRGQLQMDRVVPDYSAAVPAAPCSDVPDYRGSGYAYLWKMHERCLALGVDFRIFEMPCWQQRQNGCGDYEVRIDNREVRIVNLNNTDLCRRIIVPERHWLSENHLNRAGSEALTHYLVTLLSPVDEQPPVVDSLLKEQTQFP